MTSDIHSAASTGYQREAATYERGRPEYPGALGGWLRDTLGCGPGRTVIDVGAGTGKFTKLLVRTGAQVKAVEPIDAMREQLAKIEGAQPLAGTAQQLPLPDASADAITCAQAFHWFAHRETLDEFARVLKPGGKLGLVWNVRDESVDWVAQITRLITPLEGDAPRYYKGDWRKPFPHPAFTELRETHFQYEHTGSPQEVIVDRFMSVSFIASASAPQRDAVRASLEELIATHPALMRREVVSFPYKTVAWDSDRR